VPGYPMWHKKVLVVMLLFFFSSHVWNAQHQEQGYAKVVSVEGNVVICQRYFQKWASAVY
jgi:hypothetical protein